MAYSRQRKSSHQLIATLAIYTKPEFTTSQVPVRESGEQNPPFGRLCLHAARLHASAFLLQDGQGPWLGAGFADLTPTLLRLVLAGRL